LSADSGGVPGGSAGSVPRRFCFPRSSRLSGTGQFAAVRTSGRAFHGGLFILSVLRREEDGSPRFGIVTSRSVGGAVQRSRARRLLREVVRREKDSLRPGLWVVLIARRPLAAARLEEVRREWLRLASRAGILAPLER
jgi:ribonuclease P protein component